MGAIRRDVVRHTPPVGYDPRGLDGGLAVFVEEAARCIETVKNLSTVLESALQTLRSLPVLTLDDANRVMQIYERQTKAALTLVKALDELTRLRSFLAGGPDSRPDLTVRGELQLRTIVLDAVKALGMKCVPIETTVEVLDASSE